MRPRDLIASCSKAADHCISSPAGIIFGVVSVVLYLGVGLWIWFPDWYNTFSNSVMTVICYLLLFLLQGNQSKGDKAIQVKLDEIIRSIDRADNTLIGIEALTDEDLAELECRYQKLGRIFQKKEERVSGVEGKESRPPA